MSTFSTGRAYANQLTGSLHLLDLPANTLSKYVLQTRLPDAFLPSFLHEATHFWCEASDLGGTLACLELRAQRDMMLDTIDRSRFLNDVGVVDATRLLLTPLLEGMALFQEFDAFPGDSKVFADPGLWAGMLFTPLNMEIPKLETGVEAANWITERVYDAIGRYRNSPAAVRRKTEVLMQTLSGDPHFYLSGYLAVKQIWMNSATKTPAFKDRDLFLSFLRSWVFQDWILIGYVLDEDWGPTLAATLISERLHERLHELAVTDLTEEAAVYERESNSKEEDVGALIKALHLDLEASQSAVGRMRELLAHVYEGLAREDERENLYFADVAILRHRQEMMRLAIEKVQIEVNKHNRVLVRKGTALEDTYLAGAAPDQASAGVTDGWIAVYFLPKHRNMVMIAVRTDQPMICLPLDLDKAPDELKAMPVLITKVIATEEIRQSLHVSCRELARSYLDKDYTKLIAMLPGHVAELYKGFALDFVSEGYDASVQEMLDDKGMYALLERDGDLLTALAALSLHPGYVSKEDAVRILTEYELDPDWAFQRLQGVFQRTGAQIVLTSKDGEIWCRT